MKAKRLKARSWKIGASRQQKISKFLDDIRSRRRAPSIIKRDCAPARPARAGDCVKERPPGGGAQTPGGPLRTRALGRGDARNIDGIRIHHTSKRRLSASGQKCGFIAGSSASWNCRSRRLSLARRRVRQELADIEHRVRSLGSDRLSVIGSQRHWMRRNEMSAVANSKHLPTNSPTSCRGNMMSGATTKPSCS
jgi:hypothetical protein